METCLESAEFCVSSCLSQMVKMEVWMRKVQNKMDGVVPEVIDLTSEDGHHSKPQTGICHLRNRVNL